MHAEQILEVTGKVRIIQFITLQKDAAKYADGGD